VVAISKGVKGGIMHKKNHQSDHYWNEIRAGSTSRLDIIENDTYSEVIGFDIGLVVQSIIIIEPGTWKIPALSNRPTKLSTLGGEAVIQAYRCCRSVKFYSLTGGQTGAIKYSVHFSLLSAQQQEPSPQPIPNNVLRRCLPVPIDVTIFDRA
jgi:hypothetical protein